MDAAQFYAQLAGFIRYVYDNPEQFDKPEADIVNTLTHDIVGVYRANRGEKGYDVFLPKCTEYEKYAPDYIKNARERLGR